MEYIEGSPLEVPLPVAEALRLAVQIAEALDAAHRKGFVHRDLRPANIMVTKSGVKVLNFGLAKMKAPAISEETATKALTGEDTPPETLQYTSPEQLQGKEADARSDIFSFGLVLYEMLTGRPAFNESSQAILIGAILHTEPPPASSLTASTPPALDRLIRQCIAKDPENRWQSARDLAAELQWIAETGSQSGIPAHVIARRPQTGTRGLGTGRHAWAYWPSPQLSSRSAICAKRRRDNRLCASGSTRPMALHSRHRACLCCRPMAKRLWSRPNRGRRSNFGYAISIPRLCLLCLAPRA